MKCLEVFVELMATRFYFNGPYPSAGKSVFAQQIFPWFLDEGKKWWREERIWRTGLTDTQCLLLSPHTLHSVSVQCIIETNLPGIPELPLNAVPSSHMAPTRWSVL